MRKQIATSAAALGLLLAGVPAMAHADTQSDDGWIPITDTNIDHPAGSACVFDVHEDIVQAAEEYRIASTYPDGTPLETDFRGPLVVRYTNESTGASVERDLSGTAQRYTLPDKTNLWISQEHFGLTVHPGDPYHAAGIYDLNGPAVFEITPDHYRIVLATTQVENICDTLG